MTAYFVALVLALHPWLAVADEPEASRDEPCVVVWSNFFPLVAAERQYGPGVYEEYSLEFCSAWYQKRITLWRRMYREYTDGKELKQQDIARRELITSYQISPFRRGEATVPPHVESEHSGYER